jgi:hypothetical protein
MPQVPPLLHAEALLVPLNESELPPETLAANVETFFFTSWLLQTGQVTTFVCIELLTSSSKFLPQWSHTNSKSGIYSLTV